MMDWSTAGWIMMGLGMVLFWGLLITGILWLVRAGTGEESQAHERREIAPERSAIETLDNSLAEGRIEVEDYMERRRVLTGSR